MAYLTAQQVRDRARSDDLNDTDRFPDEDLERWIAAFEELAHRYTGTYFGEHTVTETHQLCRASTLVLRYPLISIDEFEVDGTASTSYRFGDASDKAAGLLSLTSYLSGACEITYTYGTATVPYGIQEACVQYVRAVALRSDSGAGRDVIQQGFDGGSTRYSIPDWGAGRPTGYIEVDRLLNEHGRALPGIA